LLKTHNLESGKKFNPCASLLVVGRSIYKSCGAKEQVNLADEVLMLLKSVLAGRRRFESDKVALCMVRISKVPI
jgi:hypothetical protein